jgi:enoyl-CoA hydratase/carnithine racemase
VGDDQPKRDQDGPLLVERKGAVLWVTFNRPEQRNAITWPMYEGLVEACERADREADDGLRVMALRGAGGEAFVAGTDIGQFTEFTTGADGIAYERRMSALLDRLASVRVPTVAVVTGYCVGAGLALAATCDLRIAAEGSSFGVPIARTLGNCLSIATTALLVDQLGANRTLDLLLRARFMDAEEAHTAGFVNEVCAATDIDAVAEDLVGRLAAHAPLTMWAAKEAVRRLRTAEVPDDADLLHRVYASEDFAAGVRAFLAKNRPTWTGR